MFLRSRLHQLHPGTTLRQISSWDFKVCALGPTYIIFMDFKVCTLGPTYIVFLDFKVSALGPTYIVFLDFKVCALGPIYTFYLDFKVSALGPTYLYMDFLATLMGISRSVPLIPPTNLDFLHSPSMWV